MHTLQTSILLVTIGLFAVITYGDVISLRIPNPLCAAVAILGVLRLGFAGDFNAACWTITAALAIFLLMLFLFQRGVLGGGDTKLLVATVLLIGYQDLFPFFVVMAFGGALVAVAVMLLHSKLPLYLGPRLAVALTPTRAKAVPYGVAIASAAIVILLFQSSLIG
jgi:prepilin peptidase CpaA